MTTMLEALAAKYKVYISPEEAQALQENRTRSTDMAPMGTTVPSKRQNKARSGRSYRKQARSQQTLRAVGGVGGHWTKAALKPADYTMCKVR